MRQKIVQEGSKAHQVLTWVSLGLGAKSEQDQGREWVSTCRHLCMSTLCSR